MYKFYFSQKNASVLFLADYKFDSNSIYFRLNVNSLDSFYIPYKKNIIFKSYILGDVFGYIEIEKFDKIKNSFNEIEIGSSYDIINTEEKLVLEKTKELDIIGYFINRKNFKLRIL